ncbi:MAG: GtrA family protein [Pseudonocardiaceae bacterium]|nr:GtrA family protein [Pseudonocardiaceae bacterium]
MLASRKLWHRPLPRAARGFGRDAGWYLVAGVTTTGMQMLVFLALRLPFGSVAANLVAIAVTTVANTEFHRRVTFADHAAPAGRRHLQTVLTFAFYAGYGSAVLMLLHALVVNPAPLVETIVLASASVAGGVGRFVLLRWWVFVRR